MLIDTHTHLNFDEYKDDVDEVIKRTLGKDIWLVNVGIDYETSQKAIKIAEKYQQGVYAAIALHPIEAANEKFDYKKYKELAKSEKVIAIGEIGLDYKYFKKEQRDIFLKQIDLAKELNLPVIFHCRMAHDDFIKIVDAKIKGVIHCFTGTWQQAQKYLDLGFYLGFNGIIFKMKFDEIIKKTPLDKILIETDCPFLTPPQETGRNEPLYVKYVVEKIAQLKNLSYEEIAKITTQNAKTLFKI